MNVLRLVPDLGGEVVTIDQEKVLIGRDPACDIRLGDGSVSRRHAEIQRADDEWVIADLKSGNGVLVDDVPVTHAVLLPGQRVQFGNLVFRVEIDRGEDGSTVILGRSPLARDSTIVSPGRPAEPVIKGRNPLPIIALIAASLLAVAVGFAAAFYAFRRPPQKRAATPPQTPVAVASVRPTPTPAPLAPTPTPTPKREVARPRSSLLVSTDTRAVLFIDGQRHSTVQAGGLLRIEVSPGEHIVSFLVDGTRHDEVVRAKAYEQSVVRFLASTPGPAAPAMSPTPPAPVPSHVPLARTTRASPSPRPIPARSPTPPGASPTDSPLKGAGASDDGLRNGIAATTAGDFQGAVFLLKDVEKRLEKDPSAGGELARAQAYLAWAYHGLRRSGDAKKAARKAVRTDPGVLARLDGFPAPVASLLQEAR